MYLTSTYYIKPAPHASSSKKNFFSDSDNLRLDETVALIRNIRNTDLRRANVILNLRTQEVVKCRQYRIGQEVVVNPEYGKLLAFFHDIYPNEIDAALKIAQKQPETAE